MKCRSLLSILLVVIMITSGPLALPLTQMINKAGIPGLADALPLTQQVGSATESNAGDTGISPSPTAEPKITISCSVTRGASPLYVTLTADVSPSGARSQIQAYEWDFDGDGLADYASLDSPTATHVYEAVNATTLTPTLTAVLFDGRQVKATTTINIDPVDASQWLVMRNLGSSKVAVNVNGTIVIYDSSSWLPLSFSKYGKVLTAPSVRRVNGASRLTYSTGKTLFDVTLEYGVAGRVFFNFTEYLPAGSMDAGELLVEPTLPKATTRGDLSFAYEAAPALDSLPSRKADMANVSVPSAPTSGDSSGSVNMTKPASFDGSSNTAKVLMYNGGSGIVLVSSFQSSVVGDGVTHVWGSGGSAYSPWKDQGVTPYGEYFNNLQEDVSTETGYLSIGQTDLNLPGRGLDLTIRRVYAEPAAFEGNTPAASPDYKYQAYPWAPMGNGWELSFPWMESSGGTPTYIHLGNGQRYQYNSANLGTNEYHSGDQFKLYKYGNGTYNLYTADGIVYRFDSSLKLTQIRDPSANTLTFTYSSSKISTITDATGQKTAVFSYNANGLVSSITLGYRTVRYYYNPGYATGYQLYRVQDPSGRNTTIRYLTDYIIGGIFYPTGGYHSYQYGTITSAPYTMYMVTQQTVFDGNTTTAKTFTWDATFGCVNSCTIKESDGGAVKKTSKLSYSSGSVTTSTWDGDTMQSQGRLDQLVETIDNIHHVKTLRNYPGNATSSVVSVYKYDNWWNQVYLKDYSGQESYSSYVNTNSTNKFVDSNSTQVTLFGDSFYSNSVGGDIHDRVVGSASQQNGGESQLEETYYQYDSRGRETEEKQLLSGSWLTTKWEYDAYGNVRKATDADNNLSYYTYNSTYNGAYLTSIKRLLVGATSQNLTTSYRYNSSTGLVLRMVDEKGNSTSYIYDKVGRTTNATYPSISGVTAKRSAVYSDTASLTSSNSPSTVASATSTPYVSWINRFTIRANGLWWDFYYDGTSPTFSYKTSPDGVTWSDSHAVALTLGLNDWGICFDGTYFHVITYYYLQGLYKLTYYRGTPDSNGGISWSASVVTSDSQSSWGPCTIAVDSNGYPWISFIWDNSNLYIIKDANKDGTWSSGSTYSSGISSYNIAVLKLLSLTNGKMALISSARETPSNTLDLTCMIYNGVSWGSKESITTWGSNLLPFDAVACCDNICVAYETDAGTVQFKRRDYSLGSWSNASSIVANRAVQLTRTDWYDVYAFYVSGSNIVYKVYNGISWSSEFTLVSGDSPMGTDAISASYQIVDNQIGVIYQKNSGGYSLRHVALFPHETTSPKMTLFDEKRNKVVTTYDGLGRLFRTQRYNGSVLYSTETQTYNYLSLVSQRTTATGSTYRYDYNALGDLTKLTNPDSSYSQTIINYEANTRDIRDEVNRRKILYYDWMNRLTKVKEYNGTSTYYTTYYRYDKAGNLLNVTDAKLHTTLYSYDQLNRRTTTTYSDSSYEQNTYDKVNTIITFRDRNGNYTNYGYDTLGRRVNVTLGQGTPTLLATYTYDKAGNRLTSTMNGTNESWLYDARNRITRERFVIAGSTYDVTYGYDSAGNNVWMKYPSGENVTITYDKLNRLKSLGGYVTVTYTTDDKIDLIAYGNGVNSDYSYDSLSRPHQIRVYKGASTLGNYTYTYDASGSITKIQNATSTETYGYDQLDRLTSTTGPWGSITYTYDQVGNMLTKGAASYTYNNLNELTQAGQNAYTYDAEGNTVRKTTSPAPSQQATVATGLTGNDNVDYGNQRKTWYASGRFWVMYGDGSNIVYRSSVDGVNWSASTVAKSGYSRGYYLSVTTDANYVYYAIATGGSSMFFRRGSCASNGVITWSTERSISGFTGVSYPTIAVDTGGHAYIGYISGSLPYVIKDANTDGTWSTASGFPHQLSATTGAWCVSVVALTSGKMAVEYTKDATVMSIVRFDGSSTWGSVASTTNTVQYAPYSSLVAVNDTVHMVYSAANKDVDYQNWTYSGNTWCAAVVIQGSVTSSYSAPEVSVDARSNKLFCVWLGYPQANKMYYSVKTGRGAWSSPTLLGSAKTSYTANSLFTVSYAAPGGQVLVAWTEGSGSPWTLMFQVLGGTVSYGYDALNELTRVSVGGGLVRSYGYDADGRRVRSFGGASGNSRYVYSGLSVVYEVPDAGGSGTLRFYVGSMLVAEKTGSTTTYVHQDHLGSTRLVTDSSGNRVFRDNYQPFGVDSGLSGSEEFRYTGKPTDASTGLYYFGARYYDPTIGRFITVDSASPTLSDPQSLNRYVYCRNNPMKYNDPNGLWAIQFGWGFSIGLEYAGAFGSSGGLVFVINQKTGILVAPYTDRTVSPAGLFGVNPKYTIGNDEGLFSSGTYCSYSPYVTLTPSATKLTEIQGTTQTISIGTEGVGGSVSFPEDSNGPVYDYTKASYTFNVPGPASGGNEALLQVGTTTTTVYGGFCLGGPSPNYSLAATSYYVVDLPGGSIHSYGNGNFDVW